jgi:Putative lumazine-binding
MKKYYFIFLLLTSIAVQTNAQIKNAEDSIKLTITTFFKGMQNKDTALIRTLLTPTMFMQTIERNKDKEVSVKTEPVEGWFTQLMTLPPSIKSIDERITFEKILVDDAMAMAWTPFELYLNDTYYSCGVNHFQLVRINNVWKINYIIDTRRKTCK